MKTFFSIISIVVGGVPEWLKGADCKSVGSAYNGSNPFSSTTLVSFDSLIFRRVFYFTEFCKLRLSFTSSLLFDSINL